MKALSLLSFFLLLILTAQAQRDSLTYLQGAFGGATFYQNGIELRPRDLVNLTSGNPEAYAYMKRAKTNSDWSQVLGAIGGFMIGWPLGTAIAGGDPEWGLAAGGVGVLLLSIPLTSGFKKNAIKGAEIYNSSSPPEASKNDFSLEITVSENGPGLKFSF